MTPNGNWPADSIERRAIADLAPFPRNARTHSDAQVAQIAASMQQWGWTIPLLIDEKATIIAGHGRVLAAKKLGYEQAPCMVARGWTTAQKRAYVIADNQLALNAGWDNDLLRQELADLGALGFDIELTGLSLGAIKDLDGPETDIFTKKIAAPIYEPTGPAPAITDLVDTTKSDALMTEIDEAKLPQPVAEFLKLAAERHLVFDFAKIANYYAHADKPTRALMEKSGLVIIDFDKALENGFVRLSKDLSDLFAEDHPDAV